LANFGCSTGSVDQLIEATLDEIRKLQQNGVSEEDLQKFKSEEKRQNEVKVRDNGFWLGYLTESYRNNDDPKDLLTEDQLLEKLTLADVQEAAKDYLNTNSFKRFVHLPEGK
jgi:zinc protease